MKILHVGSVSANNRAAGPSQSIRGLAKAHALVGMDVGLLSTYALTKRERIEGINGVRSLEGPKRVQYLPWFGNNDWIKRIETSFGKPDIVNFHSTYIPFNVALGGVCRKAGWPYIITPRGGMTTVAQSIKKLKKSIGNIIFFRSYVKHAAAINALTPSEAEEIQTLFKVKKVIIAPNGVEDYLLQVSKKLSAADLGDFRRDTDLMLGFVGRIDVYIKGLDLLLEALFKLSQKENAPKCKLIMVGPFFTGRDRNHILSLIQSFGLEEDVRIVGPKYGDEKWSYFLACDVFVHTSRSEGMPMAVLEAMAIGCPCLVTPGTRVGDIVREGGGWECKPDPKSIAETIKSIYEKKGDLKNLGEQSQKLILSRFTWRKVARQTSEEYAKIIEQERS
jgi:glycosyltransferase involved in cell wall biosynthesis